MGKSIFPLISNPLYWNYRRDFSVNISVMGVTILLIALASTFVGFYVSHQFSSKNGDAPKVMKYVWGFSAMIATAIVLLFGLFLLAGIGAPTTGVQ